MGLADSEHIMIPIRVKWTEPDEDRRRKARERALTCDARELDPRYRQPRNPDLDAVIEHTGILLTEPVFVPGYLETDEIHGSLPARHTRVRRAEWKCLVATATETIEMDPRRLIVIELER